MVPLRQWGKRSAEQKRRLSQQHPTDFFVLSGVAWETEQRHRLEPGQASPPPLFAAYLVFLSFPSFLLFSDADEKKVRRLRRVMMTLMSGRRKKKGGREWGIALWAQKRRRKTFWGERSHFFRYVTPSQRK